MSAAYRLAASLAAPVLHLVLRARIRAGKEDSNRLGERFGRAGRPRPAGPLVWIHAASNGEARSALGLVSRLLDHRDDLHVLFTSFTLTSAHMLSELLPARTMHQFVPLDVPAWVDRFLDHWRPELAIWIEGELWPNLVRRTAERGIPMALVNARMSARSFRRWRTVAPLLRPPIDAFDVCLAQSTTDAERLGALGAPAKFVGHLKFDGAELPADGDELARMRAAIGTRPLWLAASTHPGEEEIALQTHALLTATHPRLLTIVVPRHARRGDELAAMMRARGHGVAQRSKGERPGPETGIYLADTMGELGLFYRLARIAFVGASLVPRGGQNPLEGARLGCALAFGPYMTNCRDIADALIGAGAAVEVRTADDLARHVSTLLSDASARTRAGAAATAVAAQGRGTTERVFAELAPLLQRGLSRRSTTDARHACA
ncbi:MAG TPA: 3-deoxy-D-manno-octulosonic acid transferase [Alphaproteobacteria bacterium]